MRSFHRYVLADDSESDDATPPDDADNSDNSDDDASPQSSGSDDQGDDSSSENSVPSDGADNPDDEHDQADDSSSDDQTSDDDQTPSDDADDGSDSQSGDTGAAHDASPDSATQDQSSGPPVSPLSGINGKWEADLNFPHNAVPYFELCIILGRTIDAGPEPKPNRGVPSPGVGGGFHCDAAPRECIARLQTYQREQVLKNQAGNDHPFSISQGWRLVSSFYSEGERRHYQLEPVQLPDRFSDMDAFARGLSVCSERAREEHFLKDVGASRPNMASSPLDL